MHSCAILDCVRYLVEGHKERIEGAKGMSKETIDQALYRLKSIAPDLTMSVAELILQELCRQVRLEEVKFWEHLVGAEHALLGQEDCQSDCMYCARIESLQQISTSPDFQRIEGAKG